MENTFEKCWSMIIITRNLSQSISFKREFELCVKRFLISERNMVKPFHFGPRLLPSLGEAGAGGREEENWLGSGPGLDEVAQRLFLVLQGSDDDGQGDGDGGEYEGHSGVAQGA